MIVNSEYTISIKNELLPSDIQKGNWLVIMYAKRIPPHIGVFINGKYSSLTIKGHEINVDSNVIFKIIQQKKTETLFVKLLNHPVFSYDFQREAFLQYLMQFPYVEHYVATCLSPIKLYLQEFYAIPLIENELLFELIERLKQNNYIENIYSLNLPETITEKNFQFNTYTNEQLQNEIKHIRTTNS